MAAIVDRTLCAGAGALGVAFFAAAIVRLTAPVGVVPAAVAVVASPVSMAPVPSVATAVPVNIPRPAAATIHRPLAKPPATFTLRSRPPHQSPRILAARGTPSISKPLALPIVPARKTRLRLPGLARRGSHVDPNATPEPPVGYDPRPMVAGADAITQAPLSAASSSAGPVSFRPPSHGR
jgi:hypothetical protein